MMRAFETEKALAATAILFPSLDGLTTVADATPLDAIVEAVSDTEAQSDPEMMTSDSAALYWLDVNAGSVMEIRKTGGAPLPIATAQVDPVALAVAGSYVYWAVGGSSGEVRCAPK